MDGTRAGRRMLATAAAAVLGMPLLAACGSGDSGTTINVYYAPEQNFAKVVEDCNRAAGGRYRIVYNVLPRGADDQRVQMARRLAAADTGMDVLGLDVTWTQEFAGAEWILEWTGDRKAQAENGTLEGPLATARYEDKLYAAPKNTNVQLLWYRTDLVSDPPETWDEMIKMAQDLKAQGKTYQILTMGAQYKSLSLPPQLVSK